MTRVSVVSGAAPDSFELLPQTARDTLRFGSTCLAYPVKLHKIKSALPDFQSSDQIALTSQLRSKLALVQSRLLPERNHGLAQAFGLPRMYSFLHAPILRAGSTCTQNASSVILVSKASKSVKNDLENDIGFGWSHRRRCGEKHARKADQVDLPTL